MRNTVLIVDDDPIIQMFFSEELETLGWKTLAATSTRGAMDIMVDHQDTIAVVITDIDMPGTRNGITFANQLRFGWPQIGVIVMSGAKRPDRGALPDDVTFYSKPLPVEILLGAIDQAIASTHAAEPVSS